ncbi:MAG: alpha/beta fold hydrolase [Deltaproteobacteria bacterium]|nr:alpha/beta fold hydrolase [Deltaproteobacteria bacterium]
MRSLLIVLYLLLISVGAYAAPCEREDFETRVSGGTECLLMRRYGSLKPTTMVLWIHGNITSGGPANSHFRIAQKVAEDHTSENVLALALVRPGYPDGTGKSSSGNDYGRADNWSRATIDDIGAAIERLRDKYKPSTVLLVGHSGGAAIAAVLLGMKPQLAEGAVLVACPCDLITWRAGRRGGTWISEDPMRWIDKVSPTVKVIALTGSRDDTTAPELARTYIEGLKARGIDAHFQIVPGLGHVDLITSPAVEKATSKLIHR